MATVPASASLNIEVYASGQLDAYSEDVLLVTAAHTSKLFLKTSFIIIASFFNFKGAFPIFRHFFQKPLKNRLLFQTIRIIQPACCPTLFYRIDLAISASLLSVFQLRTVTGAPSCSISLANLELRMLS